MLTTEGDDARAEAHDEAVEAWHSEQPDEVEFNRRLADAVFKHSDHFIRVTGAGGDVEAFVVWCATCASPSVFGPATESIPGTVELPAF